MTAELGPCWTGAYVRCKNFIGLQYIILEPGHDSPTFIAYTYTTVLSRPHNWAKTKIRQKLFLSSSY